MHFHTFTFIQFDDDLFYLTGKNVINPSSLLIPNPPQISHRFSEKLGIGNDTENSN
jgi:hypothetical protein